MIAFTFYLIKVTLCSAVLYAYYFAALRNRVFHQFNRFYLLAAILFSLAFPLIPQPALSDTSANAQAGSLYRLLLSTGSAKPEAGSGAQSMNWPLAALVVYGGVALLLLMKLAAGLWQIRKLLHQSTTERIGAVFFVPTDHSDAPFSFFNWLFWKKEIDLHSEGGQSIFRHELVHIREHHTLDKMLLQTALSLFWVNPVFWIIRKELQLIHEFIADKKAVGPEGTEALAAMILHSVYGKQLNKIVNPFYQQPIKRRLAMLHKTLKQSRTAYLGRMLALPLSTLLLFAFSQPRNDKQSGNAYSQLAATKLLADTLPVRDTHNIKDVHVDATGDSVHLVTITYKNGKKITYKEKPNKDGLGNALLIIDGKEFGRMADFEGDKFPVKQEIITSMNVLKDKNAVEKYGEKGKSGVIEITTKKQ